MNKLLTILLLFSLCIGNHLRSKESLSSVTYLKPQGRLGDQLFCYSKAKWISYTYDLPLYYQIFKYSNELFISLLEKPYNGSDIAQSVREKQMTQKKIKGNVSNSEGLKPENFVYINTDFNDNNTVYVIDQFFFPEKWKQFVLDNSNVICPYNICYTNEYTEIGINKFQMRHDEMIRGFKQDTNFIEELCKVIKPINEIQTIDLPHGIISVAVHVRIGGGFDPPLASPYFYESFPQLERYTDFFCGRDNSLYYKIQRQTRDTLATKLSIKKHFHKQEVESDIIRPLKQPPMQFYVDQIKGLSAMLKDAQLWVYIFTDQPNPIEIKNRFAERINKKNIIFACREEENNHNSNVLEDLFSMTKFDCLIRPYSSLSQIAELIGNPKVVISPFHGIWYQKKLIIDEVMITIYDNNFINTIKNINLPIDSSKGINNVE